MSLPYGLHILNGKESDVVVGMVGDSVLSIFRGNFDNTWDITDVRPLLRPLSDLTKPIEHKGEKFVPIVELAKFLYKRISIAESFKLIEDRVYFESISDNQFWYSKEMKCFCSMFENSDIPVHAQLQLFQQLLKWHFDIADLISKGEAIDVNTLDINPYK